MKAKYLVAALAFVSATAFALPSFTEVENTVNAGNYPQAEQMMQEVVAARPNSAKAHYVYAEILAHDAKFDQAAREAGQAQQLDPALSFTDPAKFRDFQRLLQREQAGNSARAGAQGAIGYDTTRARRSDSLPGWVWGLGIGLIGFLIWWVASRRAMMNRGVMGAPGYGPGVNPYGTGPMGPGGPMSGGAGGSLLGTGLAAAGGLAGGMLLERYLEGQNAHAATGAPFGAVDDGSGQAASDLENRPIDFGGGNDWGGDAGGGADFSPGGGGDDSGGGW